MRRVIIITVGIVGLGLLAAGFALLGLHGNQGTQQDDITALQRVNARQARQLAAGRQVAAGQQSQIRALRQALHHCRQTRGRECQPPLPPTQPQPQRTSHAGGELSASPQPTPTRGSPTPSPSPTRTPRPTPTPSPSVSPTCSIRHPLKCVGRSA